MISATADTPQLASPWAQLSQLDSLKLDWARFRQQRKSPAGSTISFWTESDAEEQPARAGAATGFSGRDSSLVGIATFVRISGRAPSQMSFFGSSASQHVLCLFNIRQGDPGGFPAHAGFFLHLQGSLTSRCPPRTSSSQTRSFSLARALRTGDSGRFPDGGTFGGDVPQGPFAEWSRHGGSPRPQEPGQGIRQINHSVASSVWAPSGNGPASALQSTGTIIRDDISAGQRGGAAGWIFTSLDFVFRLLHAEDGLLHSVQYCSSWYTLLCSIPVRVASSIVLIIRGGMPLPVPRMYP